MGVAVKRARCLHGASTLLTTLPHASPQVDTVAVLEPPFGAAPPTLIWRGGVLLAALDSPDSWLFRGEWCEGAGSANRHSRLLFYCRAQQGQG